MPAGASDGDECGIGLSLPPGLVARVRRGRQKRDQAIRQLIARVVVPPQMLVPQLTAAVASDRRPAAGLPEGGPEGLRVTFQ
jgi:hypothetical protein